MKEGDMIDGSNPAAADSSAVIPVTEGESEFRYFRVLDPVTPYEYIKGIIRQRIGKEGSSSQLFIPSQGWEDTALLHLHRIGRTDDDLVEITPENARTLIAQLQAIWRDGR